MTYEVDGGLSVLLGGEDEGSFQSRLGLLEGEEGLVRALGLAALLGRQDDLEGVGATEIDRLLGEGLVAEPVMAGVYC